MFAIQINLFWILPRITSATLLTLICFVILMCYGGSSGTTPAFAADYFGSANIGPIYGLMLTAWGCSSAFGPILFARLRQSSGSYTLGLHLVAVMMAVSVALPIFMSPPVAPCFREASSKNGD